MTKQPQENKDPKLGDDVVTRDGQGFIIDIIYIDQTKYVVLFENNQSKECTLNELKMVSSLDDEPLPDDEF